jgi:hypothetical protein
LPQGHAESGGVGFADAAHATSLSRHASGAWV